MSLDYGGGSGYVAELNQKTLETMGVWKILPKKYRDIIKKGAIEANDIELEDVLMAAFQKVHIPFGRIMVTDANIIGGDLEIGRAYLVWDVAEVRNAIRPEFKPFIDTQLITLQNWAAEG